MWRQYAQAFAHGTLWVHNGDDDVYIYLGRLKDIAGKICVKSAQNFE